MKKENELLRDLTEMVKETKAGRLKWKIEGQTTEYNDADSKLTTIEDGVEYTVDECYMSYMCEYKGEEFLMVTYEMIHTNGDKQRTNNFIFLPPLGIRYFDVKTLLPYSVEASNVLVYEVHALWLTLLDTKKRYPDNIEIDMSPRQLEIEDNN